MLFSSTEALEKSLSYLRSPEALASIALDPYWPKWNSPWWHMTTLNELGLAKKIPEPVIRKMVEGLNRHYPPIFPIHPHDLPPGVDPSLGTACHCMVGNMYQTLDAWGLDVDAEVPWMRPWFYKYQLPDGGLNCDSEAYLKDVSPSSMVATISPLEAVLYSSKNEFSPEDIQFLDRGAKCLLDRKLMFAGDSPHNSDEKEDEADWLMPCFPRLYFYDILRGLSFVLNWASIRKQPIAATDLAPALVVLEVKFPDGKVRVERHSYEGVRTRFPVVKNGETKGAATHFALLDETSEIGSISETLTMQWEGARARLENLKKRGLILEG